MSKIYKKMTANDSKSYLGYFNKLVDQYITIHHCPISKEPIDADYSDLTEEIESSYKASKFKVGNRVRITKYKSFSVKFTLQIGQEKYLLSILC